MGEYDLIAIGAGPAGNGAAQQAVLRGGRACLVEAGPMGGTCVNVGCMPTKAMLAGSERAQDARRSKVFGISMGTPTVDGQAYMNRVKSIVSKLRQAVADKAEAIDNLDIVRGRGRLIDPHTVEVQTEGGRARRLTARAVVVATGSQPVRPDFLPWDSPRLLTSDEAVALDDLPESILIMGGGPLGCEFATIYAELGIETHLVEQADRLLPQMDPDAAPVACDSLTDRQARVYTGTEVTDITETSGHLLTRLADGTSIRTAAALVAVGRRANLEAIGLDELGVHHDDYIPVDDACRTNVEGVYAGGDVAEPRNHTHLAERMGIVIGDQIMGVDTRDDRRVVPAGVYTHPEIATVGLTERQARREGLDVRIERRDYADSAAAELYDRTAGFVKLVAENHTQRICGALWAGPHAVDMIHECALAIKFNLTLEDIFNTIHAHPSFQEAIHVITEDYCNDKLGC